MAPGGVTVRGAGDRTLANLFSVHVGEAPQGQARLAAVTGSAESPDRPGTLLAAYTLNAGARELCQSSECTERVLREVEEIHHSTAAREELREHLCWCWDNSPWAKGAFAITPPNDLTQYFQEAKRNEGRVYFAGEHVSIAPGWIQGALESSLREVARMLRET